jgi:hypothetical protein
MASGGTIAQIFERKNEAPEAADSFPQFLGCLGNAALIPWRHQREVNIAARHEADALTFERVREFGELLRNLGRDLETDKDAPRPVHPYRGLDEISRSSCALSRHQVRKGLHWKTSD